MFFFLLLPLYFASFQCFNFSIASSLSQPIKLLLKEIPFFKQSGVKSKLSLRAAQHVIRNFFLDLFINLNKSFSYFFAIPVPLIILRHH